MSASTTTSNLFLGHEVKPGDVFITRHGGEVTYVGPNTGPWAGSHPFRFSNRLTYSPEGRTSVNISDLSDWDIVDRKIPLFLGEPIREGDAFITREGNELYFVELSGNSSYPFAFSRTKGSEQFDWGDLYTPKGEYLLGSPAWRLDIVCRVKSNPPTPVIDLSTVIVGQKCRRADGEVVEVQVVDSAHVGKLKYKIGDLWYRVDGTFVNGENYRIVEIIPLEVVPIGHLRVGSKVRQRDGEIHTVEKVDKGDFLINGIWHYASGKANINAPEYDIVEIIKEASPAPEPTFTERDYTDALCRTLKQIRVLEECGFNLTGIVTSQTIYDYAKSETLFGLPLRTHSSLSGGEVSLFVSVPE